MKQLLVILLIAAAGIMAWQLSSYSGKLVAPATPASRTEDLKISVLAKEAIELDLPITEATAGTTGLSCESERKYLFDHSVTQILESFLRGDVNLASGCWPPIVGLDESSCVQLKESPDDETLREACHSFLMMTRAQQVEAATKDWDHYDSMEISVLVNKIVALLTRIEKLLPEELLEWRKMTEALVRRQPDSTEAVKAHLVTFLSDMGPDSLSPEGEMWSWVERGLQLSPQDQQLNEIYLFAESQREDGPERLEVFVQRNPELSIGYYHLAAQAWRNKKRAECIRHLEKALALEPENGRYQDSLHNARNPRIGFDQKIFAVQLGFSWDQL